MVAVQAPNGDVYDLPDSVASGLVASANAGWSYPAAKSSDKPAKKPSAKSSDK